MFGKQSIKYVCSKPFAAFLHKLEANSIWADLWIAPVQLLPYLKKKKEI